MPPGTVAVVLAVLTMVSAGVSTGTLVEQRLSVPPAGQLLPSAAVFSVAVSNWLPGSGFLTVTVPVTVTVPPTGISPVHDAPALPTVIVPDVAVWSPLGTASSNTSEAFVPTVMPKYGTCPALVNVAVYRTTPPGVVDATFAWFTITSCATLMARLQSASVLPGAQVLPVVAEVIVLASTWLPVSGLATVTE